MSIIGDIFASRSAAKGQQRAADAAKEASAASLAEQKRQYDLSRADQMPWLTAGTNALGTITALNNGDYSSFTASPDYQFRQREQTRSLNARNAALGIQDSGAATKAALKYSGNLASGEYNNYYNRIAGVAGTGQVAATNNAQVGQNYAGAVTNINQNRADALGSSYVNQGNIWGNYFSGLGGQADKVGQLFLGGM